MITRLTTAIEGAPLAIARQLVQSHHLCITTCKYRLTDPAVCSTAHSLGAHSSAATPVAVQPVALRRHLHHPRLKPPHLRVLLLHLKITSTKLRANAFSRSNPMSHLYIQLYFRGRYFINL